MQVASGQRETSLFAELGVCRPVTKGNFLIVCANVFTLTVLPIGCRGIFWAKQLGTRSSQKHQNIRNVSSCHRHVWSISESAVQEILLGLSVVLAGKKAHMSREDGEACPACHVVSLHVLFHLDSVECEQDPTRSPDHSCEPCSVLQAVLVRNCWVMPSARFYATLILHRSRLIPLITQAEHSSDHWRSAKRNSIRKGIATKSQPLSHPQCPVRF